MTKELDRRTVLKSTAAGTAVAALGGLSTAAFASGRQTIRVGLVGCGGRGTGAAANTLDASPDTTLVAMADVFSDRLEGSKGHLTQRGDRVTVTQDDCYVGFDAYKQLIARDDIDMVILATPPHFRPIHCEAAVAAGKHVFMEKPVAVDPAGVRKVMAAGKLADEKGLSIVSGTQRRHEACYLDCMDRIQNGEIGEIVGGQCYWNMGGLWSHAPREEWTDTEWQLRNWLYFAWLSGDHIVEQHIHNIDVMNWAMGSHPDRVTAMGGRQSRIDPTYGHIFDHFACDFTYPDGRQAMSMCRQAVGASGKVEEHIQGTKGRAITHSGGTRFEGGVDWQYDKANPNPYVQEHKNLLASIRGETQRLNEAQRVAESTMTAIMGRMSAYSGKDLTWDETLNADLDMTPDEYAFVTLATPRIARPGSTKFDDELWGTTATANANG
ncbi:MAG: Gfo/Idh/MocA family oxidoreductase [Phycisphaerales bacterium]|nr:Gfo/Idh/MocA family oxidoreductase [Phycisphaerales bacterium]